MLPLLREKIKSWWVDDTFPNGNIAPGSGGRVVICLWGQRTDESTERQKGWRHPSRTHYGLGQEAKVDKGSQWVLLHLSVCVCVLPFVLRQVSDLVLIDPIPEDIFEEDQWKEYWWVYSWIQGRRKDRSGVGREMEEEEGRKEQRTKREEVRRWRDAEEAELGRNVKKWNAKEDWEKRSMERSKEDDKELWGADKKQEAGKSRRKKVNCIKKGRIRVRRVQAETLARFTSQAPNSSLIGFHGENSWLSLLGGAH